MSLLINYVKTISVIIINYAIARLANKDKTKIETIAPQLV